MIGGRTPESLSRGDIQLLRTKIAGGDSKTTRNGRKRGKINLTGGEGTATRTVRLFSSILSYAIDMGMIERNPAFGIKLPPGGQRHRYLSSDELRRLGGHSRTAGLNHDGGYCGDHPATAHSHRCAAGRN